MDAKRVPSSLRERLGPEATVDLVLLFNDVRAEWSTEVTGRIVDRFERRLVEETSKLRVEMTQGFASVRQEVHDGISGVRQEIAAVRHEIALNRFELLKWTFLFWVGQVFAVGSMIVLLIRFSRLGL